MRLLEDSLAEEFLNGTIKEGDQALVDVDDQKKVIIRRQSTTDNKALPEAQPTSAVSL